LERGVKNPCAGVDLLAQFFEIDKVIVHRCDDSGGSAKQLQDAPLFEKARLVHLRPIDVPWFDIGRVYWSAETITDWQNFV
jgi:hypothetical protein